MEQVKVIIMHINKLPYVRKDGLKNVYLENYMTNSVVL